MVLPNADGWSPYGICLRLSKPLRSAPLRMSSGHREEARKTWGQVSPPWVPGHLLVGLRLQTASSRATTRESVLRSMLSTPGSVCWALSGVQGQGCGQARGPAWARAGTQREQAAGATASLLQPSEVSAEGSGEAGTGVQCRAGGCWPRNEQGGGPGFYGWQWWQQSGPVAADGGWGMTVSGGELLAHPAWPGEAGNALP